MPGVTAPNAVQRRPSKAPTLTPSGNDQSIRKRAWRAAAAWMAALPVSRASSASPGSM